MIYTVTFSPAVDYVMKLSELDIGMVNRSESEEIFFGGKGINVSLVLNQLGVRSKALGFIAGFTGKAIEDSVRQQGIQTDFVKLNNGCSRINVKIKSDVETELNGQGPEITDEDVEQLFVKLDNINRGDTLVLAGSIPNTLPNDMYEKILERLSGKGIRFVVDATKDLLLNVLKYKPFLIKPNNYELEEIFNAKIKTHDDIIKYARLLQKKGAVNVLISMAEDGSILVDENQTVHKMGVPSGKTVNSVGAGDSMVAGFIAGYTEKQDYHYALELAAASGSATAFSTGLARKDDILRLLKALQVK